MSTTNRVITSALAAVFAVGITAAIGQAFADDNDHSRDEKCAGIVKATKNDCATSKNACHSHVETDKDPEAWIYLPKGSCERIAGAHITARVDPTPGVKN